MSAMDVIEEIKLRLDMSEDQELDGDDSEAAFMTRILARMQKLEAQAALATPGIIAISAERLRQIKAEGWTPEHDDEHAPNTLAQAATVYALPTDIRAWMQLNDIELWPWSPNWLKTGDRRRELEKAGALIAAELDRLIRKEICRG